MPLLLLTRSINALSPSLTTTGLRDSKFQHSPERVTYISEDFSIKTEESACGHSPVARTCKKSVFLWRNQCEQVQIILIV